MNAQRAAIGMAATVLAIVVVVVALAVGAYGLTKSRTVETAYWTTTSTYTITVYTPTVETFYATNTTTYATTVYKNVEMVGTCTAVSYIIPDTEEVSVTNVTVTSGTITMYSLSTIATSHAGETTLGTSTYSTSTYANSSAVYTTTSTSYNSNDIPSNGWTVTTCAFAPQG